ncbi:MAG: hypothetical protein JJU05_17355, partial [Verrucomicrobia bacterium]|nr:hypothetical protein [Verrucomicrobiota bacterium]
KGTFKPAVLSHFQAGDDSRRHFGWRVAWNMGISFSHHSSDPPPACRAISEGSGWVFYLQNRTLLRSSSYGGQAVEPAAAGKHRTFNFEH